MPNAGYCCFSCCNSNMHPFIALFSSLFGTRKDHHKMLVKCPCEAIKLSPSSSWCMEQMTSQPQICWVLGVMDLFTEENSGVKTTPVCCNFFIYLLPHAQCNTPIQVPSCMPAVDEQ
uniref:Uncharacterized protein n=1 Tax=Arundo donax TaxID=35708 RepID=A0A0A8ZSR6_ARUDO